MKEITLSVIETRSLVEMLGQIQQIQQQVEIAYKSIAESRGVKDKDKKYELSHDYKSLVLKED